MKLRLSSDLTLPLDLVTESISVLAIKRAGKSYLARKLTEQLHHAGQQVVIVDPKGDTWGIRSAANGKDPGLPIVILGGGHGDVPLEPTGGELVAKLVVEQRVSVLLDLADLRKYQVATFMTGFLETLYRLKNREEYRTPMMLVIDEADAIAPQRPMKGEERMLGAAEDIVRRGGQRGIGITMVTQRAAVLNKNVLSQCGILIFLRTLGLQDIDGVNEWITKHGQPEQRALLMKDLASLPRGTAWFWAPGWPDEAGIFKKIAVDPIETFDSGATPKPGEKRIAPKTVADVDLEAFRKDMAATIEKAKAEDPRELRRRIAELERELKAKIQIPTVAKTESIRRVEVPVLKDAQIKRLEYLFSQVEKILVRFDDWRAAFDARGGDLRAAAAEISATVRAKLIEASLQRTSPARTSPAGPRPVRTSSGKASLPKGEQLVLTAIAQHEIGVTREQLTVLTGYKRSTRDTYIQRLSERDLIKVNGDLIRVDDAGLTALGPDFEPLPTGDALREHWLARLPDGERRVLEVLVSAYPKAVDREVISEKTDYARSSRDTYLQRLGARKLVVSEGRGQVSAAEELFG